MSDDSEEDTEFISLYHKHLEKRNSDAGSDVDVPHAWGQTTETFYDDVKDTDSDDHSDSAASSQDEDEQLKEALQLKKARNAAIAEAAFTLFDSAVAETEKPTSDGTALLDTALQMLRETQPISRERTKREERIIKILQENYEKIQNEAEKQSSAYMAMLPAERSSLELTEETRKYLETQFKLLNWHSQLVNIFQRLPPDTTHNFINDAKAAVRAARKLRKAQPAQKELLSLVPPNADLSSDDESTAESSNCKSTQDESMADVAPVKLAGETNAAAALRLAAETKMEKARREAQKVQIAIDNLKSNRKKESKHHKKNVEEPKVSKVRRQTWTLEAHDEDDDDDDNDDFDNNAMDYGDEEYDGHEEMLDDDEDGDLKENKEDDKSDKRRLREEMRREKELQRLPNLPQLIKKDERRHITREIEKNRGLTRLRKKIEGNARVHNRLKYTKKLKKLSGVTMKAAAAPTAGGDFVSDHRAISSHVIRSKRIT